VNAARRLFSFVSRLGDGGYWFLVAAVCVAWRGQAALPFILQAALTASLGVWLYKLLKRRLVRERPFITNGQILCGAPPLDRYSFPSGHTLHAVSFTVLFTSFEPLMLFACAPFTLLVAASRVVLGLHYPSDVLAGAAIGAGLATVSLAAA
jgi:undecaprenyl-diphosphatase